MRAHIHLLPFDVVTLYGKELFLEFSNGRPLVLFGKYITFFFSRVNLGCYKFIRDLILAVLFFFLRPHVALVEYGTTACFLFRAFAFARIPYIVIFHGYDAYNRSVLRQCLEDYSIIFKESAGIVAVSDALRDQLISIGCYETLISVSPCGADPASFPAPQPGQLPSVEFQHH